MGYYRIFGGPIECLDTHVLLDPFEEQLDLPATSVKLCDRQCRQCEVVGQKNQVSVLLDAPRENVQFQIDSLHFRL